MISVLVFSLLTALPQVQTATKATETCPNCPSENAPVVCALERDLLAAGHKLEEKWKTCEQSRMADRELIQALSMNKPVQNPNPPADVNLDILGLDAAATIVVTALISFALGGTIVYALTR